MRELIVFVRSVRLHIVFCGIVCVLLTISSGIQAQSFYSNRQNLNQSQVGSSSYGSSTYGTIGSTYSPGSWNPFSSKTTEPTSLSRRSGFHTNVLGITSYDTERNMGKNIFIVGDAGVPGFDEEGEVPGEGDDPFTGDDDEKIPVGDPILPLMLMLCGYAVWKWRRSKRENAEI